MRYLFFLGATIVAYLLSITYEPTVKGWRGIVPLHSNRDDVERILGIEGRELDLSNLRIGDDQVSFAFTSASCEVEELRRWRVPVGTVTDIHVLVGAHLTIADLKLNIANYTKLATDLEGSVRYKSPEDGIELEASTTTGVVAGIWYFPRAEDLYLACPESAIVSVRTKPCGRNRGASYPSGMFRPTRGTSEDLNISTIAIESVNENGSAIFNGQVISLTGRSFAMTNVTFDRHTFSFVTETNLGISYTFNGRPIWSDDSVGKSSPVSLIGDVRRFRNGTARSRSGVTFAFRPECLADR